MKGKIVLVPFPFMVSIHFISFYQKFVIEHS